MLQTGRLKALQKLNRTSRADNEELDSLLGGGGNGRLGGTISDNEDLELGGTSGDKEDLELGRTSRAGSASSSSSTSTPTDTGINQLTHLVRLDGRLCFWVG